MRQETKLKVAPEGASGWRSGYGFERNCSVSPSIA